MKRTIVATAVPTREAQRSISQPIFGIHQKPFELDRLLHDVDAAAAS